MQRVAAVVVVALALIGLGTVASRERVSTAHWSSPPPAPSPSPASASPASPAPAPVAFGSTVSALPAGIAAQMTGVSWRPGCPVPLSALRLVRLTYFGFHGQAHQ